MKQKVSRHMWLCKRQGWQGQEMWRARTCFPMSKAVQERLHGFVFHVSSCTVSWFCGGPGYCMARQDDPSRNPSRPVIIPITENNCKMLWEYCCFLMPSSTKSQMNVALKSCMESRITTSDHRWLHASVETYRCPSPIPVLMILTC